MKNIVKLNIPIEHRHVEMIKNAEDYCTIVSVPELIKKAKFFLTMGKYRKSLSEYCEVKHDEIIGTIVGIDLENGILSCEIPEEKFRLYNSFIDCKVIPRALECRGKMQYLTAFDCYGINENEQPLYNISLEMAILEIIVNKVTANIL